MKMMATMMVITIVNKMMMRCRRNKLMNTFLSYFFVKKIPLSRRVEYVKDGSMDHSVSELVSE